MKAERKETVKGELVRLREFFTSVKDLPWNRLMAEISVRFLNTIDVAGRRVQKGRKRKKKVIEPKISGHFQHEQTDILRGHMVYLTLEKLVQEANGKIEPAVATAWSKNGNEDVLVTFLWAKVSNLERINLAEIRFKLRESRILLGRYQLSGRKKKKKRRAANGRSPLPR